MRTGSAHIWDAWLLGANYIGDFRAVGRVTVEPGWELRSSAAPMNWPTEKLPIWYAQRCDGERTEVELPNVRRITCDWSIDTDAASCTVVISNQWMKTNLGVQTNLDQLGEPGYFTFDHGVSEEAQARWGHVINEWQGVIVPNALLRTYQGYGGWDGDIAAAVDDGFLLQTGTWLVDKPRVSTSGELVIQCRDLAKLLIEQPIYPPVVPRTVYPVRYCRYFYRPETRTTTTVATLANPGPRAFFFDDTANRAWYGPSGAVLGHYPEHAFDGDPGTFWLSVGNSGPTKPYSTEWVQGIVNEWVDGVHLWPWAGGYECWISVYENGAWVDGSGGDVIPYEPLGVGRYRPTWEPSIVYVSRFGVPWETPIDIPLPRAYLAGYVRFTFTNLTRSPWGAYPYRAGAREIGVSLGAPVQQTVVEQFTEIVRYDGNYTDYAQIVKDLLLWAGFWCYEEPTTSLVPEVHGNIEGTGTYSEECLPDDIFDKQPTIDAINAVKELVGYIFLVDYEGAARFESPNWWGPGNFNELGEQMSFIPEVDELIQLTDYTVEVDDDAARSEIVISSSDPLADLTGTVTTRYIPPTAAMLKGIRKPAFLVNGTFVDAGEQQIMAELIALHIWFRLRQGQVQCWANPCVQINDQVRIWERVTGDTYIHYVRGVHTEFDAESGSYTMTLTTHWLGDEEQWAVVPRDPGAVVAS